MGHKWMWNPKWGGLPSEEFLVAVDPLLKGTRAKIGGEYLTSDHIYAGSQRSGPRNSVCGRASPFLWAPSMLIGTHWAPDAERAT